jgi:tRNA(fMet)-specific endonuclease VapC
MASFILSGRSEAARTALQRASKNHPILISALTEAELLFGLEMKPHATKLRGAVHEFLQRLEIKPWDSFAASAYSGLRAQLKRSGKALANMDLLIASHALSLDAILVSHDGAFRHISGSARVVDWATDLPPRSQS